MVDLAGVRWIGGGSGAAKSTVATLLGKRHRLRVVESDDSLRPHAAALAGDPLVDAFVRAPMDERWVERAPARQQD